MADQVKAAADDVSVPVGVNDTAVPVTEFLVPGLVTLTVLVMVHANVVDAAKPAESVTVKVTEHAQALVGVPDSTPVAGAMEMPTGRPEAVQVRVALDWVSLAEGDKVTGVPDTLDWVPGLFRPTVLVMVHVKVVEAA